MKKRGLWERFADKIGISGTVIAALCCLGFPAAISLVSAVGLGFLINDDILFPLIAVFLLLTLAGLWSGRRRHGSPWALVVGVISSAMTFVFIVVRFNKPLAYVGIAGLLASGILNIWLRSRQLK